MDLGLTGKRVIVTGGTRGIGAAIVDAFCNEGAIVSFCARSEAEIKLRLEHLESQGYQAYGSACDVADQTAYSHWLNQAVSEMAGVDIFIPNVSGGASTAPTAWRTAFDVDLMATVHGCDTLLPHLVSAASNGNNKDCSAITVIASIAAVEKQMGPPAYGAMKAAVTAYASQLSAAAAPHNIRVNSLSPGPIYVGDGYWGDVKRQAPDAYQQTCDSHAMGRLGAVDEVAKAVVFLSSPAASWITGTNLVVDGGLTKRVQI